MLNSGGSGNRNNRTQDESGFTLIEALVALVISGVLASALVSLLIGQSRWTWWRPRSAWDRQLIWCRPRPTR